MAGFQGAVSSYQYQDLIRVVKLRTGWLPVNKRATHYIEGREPICASCDKVEDIPHLFQCSAGICREEWLTRVQRGLRTRGTPDDLLAAIVLGLSSWLAETKSTCPVESNSLLQIAFDQQTAIGWGSMCRGFVASGWSAAHYAAVKPKNEVGWSIAFHKILFDAFLELWKQRNEAVHGSASEQVHREHAALAQRVRTLHSSSARLLPCDRRRLCPWTLEQILGKPKSFQRQWVRMAARAFPEALDRA